MAKTNTHHTFVDTMYEVINKGKENGLFHLYNEKSIEKGRKIIIKGQELINFGSCSYLGLDFDPRLTQAVIDTVREHGTQISSSRTYLSSGLYLELEDLFGQLFGYPVVVAPTTTLGHLSSIPVLIESDHAVILDQSVHASVREAIQGAKSRGIYVDIIRHNRLDELEDKIKELRQKYDTIWYMGDGIYSMYGDECPIEDLYVLMDKYPQLHLYIDDAHGMSWTGKNGAGFILSKVKLHERMILMTSLHKAFGSVGGVIVCPTEEIADKIKTCGNTLIFSGPINPPMLGACIASAKIHLSNEIYDLQNALKLRIDKLNQLALDYNLPYPVASSSPVFFIGTGQPNLGYNLVKRLMNEGFYLNLAIFPAVPIKKTGLRICSTLHQTDEDIERLMAAVAYHLPIATEEESWSRNKILSAFDLPLQEESPKQEEITLPFKVVYYDSIQDVPKETWNSVHGSGVHNWEGLQFLEKAFSDNDEKENNWKFHYFLIYNDTGELTLATFFTSAWWKDDMLARKETSELLEKKRMGNKYLMTSVVLSMGTPMTEGRHLYINTQLPLWKDALNLLLEQVYQLQEKTGASSIILRDFEKESELKSYFIDAGFFHLDMPDNHVIYLNTKSFDEYFNQLSKNSRRHFQKKILSFEDAYEVRFIEKADDHDIDNWYELYKNVSQKSLEINTFLLPKKLFALFVKHNHIWDIMTLTLKPEQDSRAERKPVAVLFCYKTSASYSPLIVGIDYQYNETYGCYRQAHYQAIKRAISLNCQQIRLGYSASIEKQRLGATIIPTIIFADNKDNFSMSAIDII